MSWAARIAGVRRLFRLPVSVRPVERDIDEELQFHFQSRVADLVALGASEHDAQTIAEREYGDVAASRAELAAVDRRARSRQQRAGLLDVARQDVAFALRGLRRRPALNATIILTLALCIGATTAVYSVVHHLLLTPLPYADGNRIASLEARSAGDGDVHWRVGADLYRLWMARSHTLEEFAAYAGITLPLGKSADGRSTDSAVVALVTPSFLPMLRVRPSVGRSFIADDARPGAPAVAMIGQGMWWGRFGGASDVLGRTLTVNGVERTIIGVVPQGVGPPIELQDPPAVWIPVNIDSAKSVDAFARLRPGVTSAAASRELDAILRTLPDTGWLKGRRAEARTAPDRVDPHRRNAVELLFAAAVGLLLIACADVAGLLLMRGWARRREFAVRQALGAGRGRLSRQLLTESLLLVAPCGVLGLLVAWLGLRAAGYVAEAPLDAATLVWTAGASVATALVFGAAPALLSWERSLDDALRSGGAGSVGRRSTGRAHAGLVVGQIALSLVFLAGAGVLARSFVALVRTPVGYEARGLIEVSVRRQPTSAKAPASRLTPAERSGVARMLRETLAATPGVSEVAVGSMPMTRYAPGPTFVEGPTGMRPSGVPITGLAYVSPEYFHVARIPLVRGRAFDSSAAVAAGEVVINQSLARHLWPDRDAVGARLQLGDEPQAELLTVVGVAGDVQMPGGAAEFFGLQMYRPMEDAPGVGSFVLRARGEPGALRPLLARAVERAGVGATLQNVLTAESTLEFAFRGPRFALSLFGAFALLAVALAAVGLFGIVAFDVARRTREIGIRVALGAEPAALTRAILGRSLRLVLVGCAIGLVGTYGAARALTALVNGVSPTDPTVLAAAVVLLAVVAVAASMVPVRRALRVDPTETLRAE